MYQMANQRLDAEFVNKASSNEGFQSTPSPTNKAPSAARCSNNTFVHKLATLISDPTHNSLIYWNSDGRSFTVRNIENFSKTVLPLHFKHNNFSSFIRQLNMYGFHKTNRSPRGHRSDPAYQTWEFSHKMFLRDHPDLIKEIRRTTNETESSLKPLPSTPDLSTQVSLMLSQQNEMVSRISTMCTEINQLRRELSEANRVQAVQQQVIRKLTIHLRNNSGSNNNSQFASNDSNQPTIFVTPPDAQGNQQAMYGSLSPMHHSSVSPMLAPTNQNQNNVYFFGNVMNPDMPVYNQQPSSPNPQNGRPMLSINTMNLNQPNHLSPSLGQNGNENMVSEDEMIKLSPSSVSSHNHQHNGSPLFGSQIVTSPVEDNLSMRMFKDK